MVSGRLQEKNGYYYMVLSYKDATGKRKQPWYATGLPVKGNKRRAEEMLRELRRGFTPPTPERARASAHQEPTPPSPNTMTCAAASRSMAPAPSSISKRFVRSCKVPASLRTKRRP